MNTTAAAPSHDVTARMRADISQLTNPIYAAIRGRIYTHDPLLDQLREAAIPSGGARRGPERRRIPDSQPPVHLEAVDALAEVYVAIARWHAHLRLPSPPRDVDWFKAALHQLADAAPSLAPSIADELAAAVHGWWRRAATTTGWRTEQLLRLR